MNDEIKLIPGELYKITPSTSYGLEDRYVYGIFLREERSVVFLHKIEIRWHEFLVKNEILSFSSFDCYFEICGH